MVDNMEVVEEEDEEDKEEDKEDEEEEEPVKVESEAARFEPWPSEEMIPDDKE